METKPVNRRTFLKTTAAAGGLTILPSGFLFGQNAPSNKLNVALIGTWGRGDAHFGALSDENVVALCDVDENHIAHAAKRFPKAKTYVDWRKCLDQKGIDAVVCCTTDHTHAFVTNWALNRDMHVYCEKPMGNTVEEVRIVQANWAGKKNKLATQIGTQRHSHPNFDRVRELIIDGAVGELQHVWAWGNRQIRRSGYLPAQGEPPAHLHYDLWLGPAPYHPYNPGYFSGVTSGLKGSPLATAEVGRSASSAFHARSMVWLPMSPICPLPKSQYMFHWRQLAPGPPEK